MKSCNSLKRYESKRTSTFFSSHIRTLSSQFLSSSRTHISSYQIKNRCLLQSGHSSSTMSLTTISRIALHSTALYFSFYAFNNLHSISELTGIAIESQYGGHYAFLTIIGLSVATLTQALALAEDLFGSFLPAIGFAKRIGSVISLPVSESVLFHTNSICTYESKVSPNYLN